VYNICTASQSINNLSRQNELLTIAGMKRISTSGIDKQGLNWLQGEGEVIPFHLFNPHLNA